AGDEAVATSRPAAATRPAVAAPTSRPAAAAWPDTRPPADEVPGLIAALSDPDWRARDAAQAGLVRIGEPAVPALEAAARSTAGRDESRTAARAALAQVAEDRVSGPSYVTLRVSDAPARQAYEALGRQAFTPLKPYADTLWTEDAGRRKVTVAVDRQPFWVAMRELARQTGLEVRDVNGEPRLAPAGGGPGGQAAGRAVVAGAFLIAANQVSRSRTVDLSADGDPPVQEEFNIQFTAFAEPKLKVLGASSVLKLDEAVDDRGNSLLPPPDPAAAAADEVGGPVFGGDGSYSLLGTLRYPAKDAGTRIARLRGSAAFAVQVESEKIDLAVAGLRGTTKAIKGVRVTFGELTKTGDGWQVKLTAAAAEANPLWQEVQNTIQTRLRVVDAAGQPLEQQGFGSTGNGSSVEVQLTFAPSHRAEDGRQSGDPARLTWEVPTRTRDVTVPFEFRDLKLP
ncbi:MAG: hypothetical protein JWO31_2120, partial [Phycisphaerales bacterium]|nr:hypothetical protein [Phycisphaerales bacterium]